MRIRVHKYHKEASLQCLLMCAYVHALNMDSVGDVVLHRSADTITILSSKRCANQQNIPVKVPGLFLSALGIITKASKTSVILINVLAIY